MFQPPLSIGSRLARRATRLTPGGRYAIPPNTAHRISNGGDGEDCQPSAEGRLAIFELIGLVSTGANSGVCTGARDGAMASVEVLAGPERRRRWSIEQKQAIVAAAFEPGAVVREVARQADVTASLIYRWRRDLRAAANGFAQVLVAPAGDGIAAPPPVAVIEIEFAGNARVRIPASVSPALATAVVGALARR